MHTYSDSYNPKNHPPNDTGCGIHEIVLLCFDHSNLFVHQFGKDIKDYVLHSSLTSAL